MERTAIPNATTSTLKFTAAKPTRKYFLRVSNEIRINPQTELIQSFTDSRMARVIAVCESPKRRSARHASASGRSGQNYTLSVESEGPDVTYDWYRGSEHLTDSEHFVGSGSAVTVQLTTTTIFWYRATRTCGSGDKASTDSDDLVVTVACTPTALQGPLAASASLPTGGGPATVTASVTALGDGPFSYQWYAGGTPVGTDSPAYSWTSSLPGTQQVHVAVTNACDTVTTSAAVTLAIVNCPPLSLLAFTPGGPVGEPGQGLVLSVVTEPADPNSTVNSYQWYRGDGTPLSGANQRSTTVTTYSTDSFYVTVTSPCGAVVHSPKMYVSVYGQCDLPPLSTGQSAVTIPTDSATGVTFTAFCDWPAARIQWYAGQAGDTRIPVTGDTGNPNQLTVGGVGDLPRAYWVRASLDCGTYRDSATLTYTKGECEPVLITQHPEPVEVAYGGTASLTVGVAQPVGKTFWWQRGETGIPQTAQTITLTNVTESGRYRVRVVDAECGTGADSFEAAVRVASCPSITVGDWPVEVWTDKGTAATLTIGATGVGSYRWYAGEVGDDSHPLAGTGPSFTTEPLQADAKYWVRLYGTGCIVDSPTLVVKVCDPPHFVGTLTTTTNIVAGQSVWIAVSAAGTGLQYQWYAGTSGTTTQPLGRPIHAMQVSPLQTSDYWVRISGTCGLNGSDARQVDSPTMTVSVCPVADNPPAATKTTVMPGTTTQLTIAVQGSRLIYQWYAQVNGGAITAIANSNSATITTPPVTADTRYWVEVRSGTADGCLRVSPSITIETCKLPTIRWTSSAQNVAKGQSLILEVDVVHTNGANVTYYAGPVGDVGNSTVVAGPTVNRGVQVAPLVTTTYWARADDGAGCTGTTAGLTLTVCIPAFSTQPANAGITAGQSTTLTAATDVGAAQQWYTGEPDGTNSAIADATGTSLTVSPAADTKYFVRATGCSVTVTSSVAQVTVCQPPAITQQTPSVWLTQGSSLQLSVTATGSNLTYQWYAGSTAIAGATEAYTTVTPSNTTTYFVRIGGTCGTTDSAPITISVCATPAVSAQPQSATIFSGTTATLSVTATQSTTTPMTYQWYAGTAPNGTAISGATSSSYTTPALTAQASYWVRISAGNCSQASDTAVIGICALPAVVNGAPNVQTSVGELVRLTVPVMSPAPEQYRWYRGAAGDTANPITSWSALSYTDVSPSVTTQYWAEVKYGTCTSRTNTTTVSVCVPVFTTQPAGVTINSGQSTTLTAIANTAGVTYQWYSGPSGTPVPGGTSTSITVSPGTTTTYMARATSSCGRIVDSVTVTVTICQPASIATNPQNASIQQGQSVTLSVVAGGTSPTYQWYTGTAGSGTAISGATGASLTVSPSVPTSYWVKVTTGCGTANSTTATVTICATPSISAQPQNQTIFSGTAATLSVTASQATGIAMSYQWYAGTAPGGTAISGATSSSYTTPALTGAANYWVKITSGVCSNNSNTATISMCTFPAVVTGAADVQTAVGELVRLSVPVMSPVPESYRWYRGASGDTANPITGWQTHGWVDVAPTATTQYWAQVQKGTCVSRTTTTTVSVCVPVFTTQPVSVMINSGQSTTLTAVANTAGVSYQWYSGPSGTPVPGGTSTSITVSPATTTTYMARATSSCGHVVDSVTVTVTICQPPSISSHPAAASIRQGQNATLSVTAAGTNLTYLWYQGTSGSGTSLGITTSSITVSPQVPTNYWVKVTGSCGSANSNTAAVSVCATPSYSAHPQSQSVFSGSGTTLTAAASQPTGMAVSYQWYRNGAIVSGATSSSYATGPLTASTNYSVVASSGICSLESNVATVSICTFGEVLTGPADKQTTVGEVVRLDVGVLSPAPDSYRWYRGASGDTSNPITGWQTHGWVDVYPSTTTEYWAQIQKGSCVSRTTTTTVRVCVPQFTTYPASVVILPNQSTTLTSAATTAGVTYQWYIGTSGSGSAIGGATGASYSTGALPSTTSYWVRATSTCGRTADSATATVTVCAAPAITAHPANAVPGYSGWTYNLTAGASGTGLTYQWYAGEKGDLSRPVSGATGSTLSLAVHNTEKYWVRVSGTCGSADSNAAFISIHPTINTQPQNTVASYGAPAVLSVTATGNYLSYQWYTSSGTAVGTNSRTFTTPPITSAASYYVVVKSGTAERQSSTATVNVCQGGPTIEYGPWVTNYGGCTRGIGITMIWEDRGNSVYQWYQGERGDTSTPAGNGYSIGVCVTAPTKYWCRVSAYDCFTDSAAVTVQP